MVRCDRFNESGGFSPFARVGMDTQFVLRSAVCFRVRNVVAFGYTRRIHTHSLARQSDTGLNPLGRGTNAAPRGSDFIAVVAGHVAVTQSILTVVNSSPMQLIPFPAWCHGAAPDQALATISVG